MASEGGPSSTADATTWLDVPAAANFTVRTLDTGRELRFEGPGRIRPCADDVALLAEGSAVGLPGSGEAPGAEVWAATACGVARWASGVHRFTGGKDACRLQSSLGVSLLWVAEDVTAEEDGFDAGAPDPHSASASASASPRGGAASRDAGAGNVWQTIHAQRALKLRGRALGSPGAVKAALVGCEKAAKEVEDLALRMTARDSGDVGELAARSVGARGFARAACAVAAVRVAVGGSHADDLARLDAASARWRSPH